MRRVIVAIAITIAGLVPLLRYHPTSQAVSTAPPVTGSVSSTSSAPSTGTSGGASKTVTGSAVQTEFGPYQVQATFSSGKLTDVQLVQMPSDRHSQRIAQQAAPLLRQEALQAQSAKVDTVSGATTTSQAYAQSLQAALDAQGS